jgi:hypothetical protein
MAHEEVLVRKLISISIDTLDVELDIEFREEYVEAPKGETQEGNN